jgi:D-glycero-D-manno-heptose 1,7-bisphosphate phosphatase
MKRAVFLDRDGVINRDRGYVHRWEDFEFLPGVLAAARRLVEREWTLVVVTNQSGIARGYFTEETYRALTRRMTEVFTVQGAPLAGVYHCPHHPEGRVAALAVACDCRKPAPGMFLRASDELGLSLPDSVMVGDKPSDVVAARNAGVGRSFLIRSGPVGADAMADGTFDDLATCVDQLLA